jgi:hypothetical protein
MLSTFNLNVIEGFVSFIPFELCLALRHEKMGGAHNTVPSRQFLHVQDTGG